ncbi:MAG: hypothetical protein U0X20_26555 [Caldilineaceae bacterium]
MEKGLTIFVCTPYMDEAERCTKIGLIYGGRLIAYGTPEEIKRMVPGHLLEFTPVMTDTMSDLPYDLLRICPACWKCRAMASGCAPWSTIRRRGDRRSRAHWRQLRYRTRRTA